MDLDRLIIVIGWAGLVIFALLTLLLLVYVIASSNRDYKSKKKEHEAQRKRVIEKIRSHEKSL